MKKKGLIDTLIKAGIAAAAIGGTVYLLKDKIEENPKYKEAVDKVKDKIKSYVPEKETAEDEDFFDEDFDEVVTSSERGYVNIKLPTEEDIADAVEETADFVEEKAEQAAEIIEEKAEQAADIIEEKVEQAVEAVEEITEA